MTEEAGVVKKMTTIWTVEKIIEKIGSEIIITTEKRSPTAFAHDSIIHLSWSSCHLWHDDAKYSWLYNMPLSNPLIYYVFFLINLTFILFYVWSCRIIDVQCIIRENIENNNNYHYTISSFAIFPVVNEKTNQSEENQVLIHHLMT